MTEIKLGRTPHSALSIPHLNASFPVFILKWTIGAFGVECDGMTSLLDCGDTSPLSLDATCRVGSKRGRVRALQSRITNSAGATGRVARPVKYGGDNG